LYNRLQFRRSVPTSNFLHVDFKKTYPHEKFDITQDDLKKRFIEDIFYNSLPALLRYEDKNSMRFSVEGRVPFLDKEVMEYLFGLDNRSIIRGSWNKRILRDSTKGLLPELIRRRRNKIGFTTPENEWFQKAQDEFYAIFTSESFAKRPYFNQATVVGAFQEFMRGRSAVDTMVFWRILNVEYWLREFIDRPSEAETERPLKSDMQPNADKQISIAVGDKHYLRYPLQTTAVQASEKFMPFVVARVKTFVKTAPEDTLQSPWYLYISEKIVAITQGRSYFIWDVKPSVWAHFFSRFVVRTPHGIGLGSPWTMELAIRQAGLSRVLFAAIGGAVCKVFRVRGVFYRLVGSDVNAIDGPTEYSVYPSNVSAKLPPENPGKVAKELAEELRKTLPAAARETFQGVVVIDANDLGQNVLGHSTTLPNEQLASVFKDNPLGQGSERTPLCIVIEKTKNP
jgi:asparagine synthase (glutamine-hydrolysing)